MSRRVFPISVSYQKRLYNPGITGSVADPVYTIKGLLPTTTIGQLKDRIKEVSGERPVELFEHGKEKIPNDDGMTLSQAGMKQGFEYYLNSALYEGSPPGDPKNVDGGMKRRRKTRKSRARKVKKTLKH